MQYIQKQILVFCWGSFFVNQKINNTIENFTKDLFNRNKKVVPDIGEFLIQIALSTKYQFDQIKKYHNIMFIICNYKNKNIFSYPKKKLLEISD